MPARFPGAAIVLRRSKSVYLFRMSTPQSKARLLILFTATLLVSAHAGAQNSPGPGQGQGGGFQRGEGRGMMLFGGHGTVGTVTAVAADHYTIKTETGDTYTVFYGVNTRILKQAPFEHRDQPHSNDDDTVPRTPPEPIKATDIKVGDVIAAGGDLDVSAKTVGAVAVLLVDPERAKQMRAMQADYGKTWLMGRVTAINEVRISIQGGPDNASHDFVADENTLFRKRRDPITLADIQVGDMVRVEGGARNGSFVATTVAVMGGPNDRHNPTPQTPPQ